MAKESIPHEHCRNYLPHFDNKQYQMVTFRLYDSVPKIVIETWKAQLTQDNQDISQSENNRKILRLIDQYEDSGYGQCLLKDNEAAKIMYDSLHYYDHKKYNLICWCIMPNHVHVLIEIIGNNSLSTILHSWRSYSSKAINKVFNRSGKVWMSEYFDRYIRDLNHFDKVINYIHNNPVKAGLVSDPSQFHWSSAYEKRDEPL